MSQIPEYDFNFPRKNSQLYHRNETFFHPFLTFSKRVHARMRGFEYLIIKDIYV